MTAPAFNQARGSLVVRHMDHFIQQLEQSLQGPLPGEEAQYQMAHAVRRGTISPPADARKASVLALFFPRQKDWHLVFIERQSSHPDDRHGGQIGFPGGKVEEGDRDLVDTALREAHEEVGAPVEDTQILGSLSELYIPVSNFLVHPFVGFVPYEPQFVPQPSEVRSIIKAPFALFQDPNTRQFTDLKLSPEITLRDVPYFNLDGHVLWGATAMMMSELLAVVR